MLRAKTVVKILSIGLITTGLASTFVSTAGQSSYQDLESLFKEWLAFERPALRGGAPDYTPATMAKKHRALKSYQARLAAIDPRGWPVAEQVDYRLVGAQMNGLDFDIRVLQPWTRDPAFYVSIYTEQSDTPAHEGPTHHAVVELWRYNFPLALGDESKLAAELSTIPPLLKQARTNLTGNARDLWITGTASIKQQSVDLAALAETTAKSGDELAQAIAAASKATAEFATWLDQQTAAKTGPSGVGKDNYTWSLENVHLVPMTWDDEVALLKRELARAHASLRYEEERNRNLPQLQAAGNKEEWDKRANDAVTKYIAFLRDKKILTVTDYLDPALRAHLGGYVPLESRNFFDIARHYEPVTLYAHAYHWFDHAWMIHAPNPSAIRRAATLYNVWDNRAEGMATAMEELILHAGYYDDNPRAREIVWIMLAQRCARGLASLYAQANQFDIKQAKAFQVEWTPRGWMRPDLDLLGFEQQLYLRQPGYGTSYVTGKYLIEELIKNRSHQMGEAFTLRRFFDEFNDAGLIPVSLIGWQMTAERPQSNSGM